MDKKYSKNELFYGICRYFPPPFDAQREGTTHSSPFRWSCLIEKEASLVRRHSFTPSWTHGGRFLNKHSSSPSSFYPVSGCSVHKSFLSFDEEENRRERRNETGQNELGSVKKTIPYYPFVCRFKMTLLLSLLPSFLSIPRFLCWCVYVCWFDDDEMKVFLWERDWHEHSQRSWERIPN